MTYELAIGNKCFSSWSLRPWVAMTHAGIPFREVFVRLRTPGSAAALAAVSPSGVVPVLRDGGIVIWETLAILEYLNDAHPMRASGRPIGWRAASRGPPRPKCTPDFGHCAMAGR
jgi:glutathione S-transferase